MPRYYSVPMELRKEERIVGNILSLRQLGYLLAGVIVSAPLFLVARAVVRPFAGNLAAIMVGAIPVVFLMAIAALLAFAPAGLFGILPGPKNPPSPDPFDPPLRLDQWLVLSWKFARKRKQLPYRRTGYRFRVGFVERKGG